METLYRKVDIPGPRRSPCGRAAASFAPSPAVGSPLPPVQNLSPFRCRSNRDARGLRRLTIFPAGAGLIGRQTGRRWPREFLLAICEGGGPRRVTYLFGAFS